MRHCIDLYVKQRKICRPTVTGLRYCYCIFISSITLQEQQAGLFFSCCPEEYYYISKNSCASMSVELQTEKKEAQSYRT